MPHGRPSKARHAANAEPCGPMLIDSHCHLDADAFDPDRDEVIRRARSAGVGAQVVPATHAAGWPKLRAVCVRDQGLFPAYGLHPVFLREHRREHIEQLGDWVEREQPVAIGECGLDYFDDSLDRTIQQLYFDAQLQLARDTDLPLIVHARRAVEDVILAIRRVGQVRGVVHSFGGSPEQAARLYDLGFMIGLGGPVTYARAHRLRRLVADMPIDQLLLETDAPDQPDSDIRGQRNEPARLTRILDVVAQLRDEPAPQIARATSANARRLFGLPES